jgi:hypothetical protein
VVPAGVAAQQPSQAPLATSSLAAARGVDTVSAIVIHVRAARQEDYERWLRGVVVPAQARARQRFKSVSTYSAGLQVFVPATRSNDSTVTYLYLVPHVKPEPGRSTKGGFRALLEDAGLPPAEVDRQITALRSMEAGGEVYTFVRGRLFPTP